MGLSRRELLLGGASLGAAAGLSGCAGLTRSSGEQTAGSGASGGPASLTFVNWSGEPMAHRQGREVSLRSQARPTRHAPLTGSAFSAADV